MTQRRFECVEQVDDAVCHARAWGLVDQLCYGELSVRAGPHMLAPLVSVRENNASTPLCTGEDAQRWWLVPARAAWQGRDAWQDVTLGKARAPSGLVHTTVSCASFLARCDKMLPSFFELLTPPSLRGVGGFQR